MPSSHLPTVAVIGANGRTGKALCRALAKRGQPFIACSRTPDAVRQTLSVFSDTAFTARPIDLQSPSNVSKALHGASYVMNTAHARYLPAILHATKAPIIALGSTRKNTRWPDAHASGVLAGERALQADPRPSIILHPTMIYGAEGENNVQRLAHLLRYLPIIPLPNHGRALVQPIEQHDVVRCLLAALDRLVSNTVSGAESITLAGATPLSYRCFIMTIIEQAGQRQRPVVSVPANLLMLVARLTALIPGLPTIHPHEVRRLLEDKHADITEMTTKLNVHPVSFHEGMRKLFKAL